MTIDHWHLLDALHNYSKVLLTANDHQYLLEAIQT